MNIVRKDIDQCNATITLRIEKADYSEKVEKTLRDYRKKANIPGFRPGMIPVGLVKKMYGKAVLAEEINKIVSEELYNYIRENKINLLGEPLANKTEQQAIDFNTQDEFEFIFDLGIAPEFTVELSEDIKAPYYSIIASEEMIENQVKSYTSRYGKYIQEEIAEEKDMLKGEIFEMLDGEVKADGIKISDAVLTPAYMKDEAIKAQFVGAAKGAVIVFNPAKAFENDAEISSLLKITKEEAQVITSDFQYTIEGITRYHESEINQEFFDKVYGEAVVNSEDEFRAKIKADLQENLIGDSEYKFSLDARDALLAKYDSLVFPDEFLKRWVLTTNEKVSEEALEADYPKMIADLKWQLIKDKIAKANEIKVETEDVNDYAKKIAKAQFAQYGMIGMDDEMISNYAKDMLKKEETLKNIVEKVAETKIFDIVKSAIKLENKDVSIEDFNKMFEN